ncbi:stage II sporulation protein P [Halobacillus shinanisalinarum]|uniref:Stage II sporulation protein P n=1 Tax=Halobacillus shinanisalinarum TaxID=2932258 RepID=A0ABY4H116_9BACI|nr:stage II sporulation protein P [Halobacillus shinanisalinarum]UOQ94029.1 stage II sporulation protein P [Halobacillus shinanisalinarum]
MHKQRPTSFISKSMRLIIKYTLPMIVILYLIVTLITSTGLKEYFVSPFIYSISKAAPEEAALFIMAQEMTPLRVHYSDKVTKQFDWMEMATNVDVGDIRSLLGREIPGLERYHTEIAIAGKGTDLSTLPVESLPPTEEQLQNQEVNQSQLDLAEEEGTPQKNEEISKKSVYIYQSHSWEAYKPLIKSEHPNASSTNEKVNVIAVGTKLKEELEGRGIGVKHDKTNVTKGLKERNLDYTHSYEFSRGLVQEALAQNDNLSYLIDIHRDSQPRSITTTTINGKDYARLFFIVGKENEKFEQNLEVAKEINAALEQKYPGISRGVFVKTKLEGNGVYNQDLTNRAMLLEFGGVENNLNELYNSIEAFAEVFSTYYRGDAEKVNAN